MTYQRVYHYHVRKTAGTSLNEAFWALGGLDLSTMGARKSIRRNGLVFLRHDRKLIAAGDYFFANSHLPHHQVHVPPGTFTITILRDPVARLMSYYRYLLWARDNPTATHVEPALSGLRAETRLLGTGLDDFVSRLPPDKLLQQVAMFSGRMDPGEAAANALSCSAVCFTETFAEDLARLARTLDLPLEEKNARRFGATVSLPPRDRAHLQSLLEPEYVFLDGVRKGLRSSARNHC